MDGCCAFIIVITSFYYIRHVDCMRSVQKTRACVFFPLNPSGANRRDISLLFYRPRRNYTDSINRIIIVVVVVLVIGNASWQTL